MKKLILMVVLIAVCGVVQAGESDDVVQKSAIQKGDACQKAEGSESMGFFGRIRNRRANRIEARQSRRAAWFSARSYR